MESIGFWTQELSLMQRRFIPHSPEKEQYARDEIVFHADELFRKNQEMALIDDDLSEALINLHKSRLPLSVLLSNGTASNHNFTLSHALMMLPGRAKQIAESPLEDISLSNPRVWFLLSNADRHLEKKLHTISQLISMESKNLIQEINILYTVSALMSLVSLVVLCVFAIRPAVISVLEDKESAILKFFDLDVSHFYHQPTSQYARLQ